MDGDPSTEEAARTGDGAAPPSGQGSPRSEAVAEPNSLFSEWASFEPTVAVGPDGTVYATSAWGNPFLAVRPDGKQEALSRPVPSVAPFLGAQPSDVMIQVGPDGKLYFHALLYHVENNGVYYAFMLVGLYVAVSEDGGKTWPTVTYIGIPDSPQTPQLGADRQWLAVAEDGTLYLIYQRVPPVLSPRVGPVSVTQHYAATDSGVMFSRSDDGGQEWTAFRKISGPNAGVINGQPILDGQGRLIIPFFEYGAQRAFKLAVSEDRGDSFDVHDVYAAAMPGQWFPAVADLGKDGLLAVWVGPEDKLHVARSDRGVAWSTPMVWSGDDATVATSPWVIVDGGVVHVLWFRDEGTASSSLWWSTAHVDTLDAPTHHRVDALINGTTAKRAMTDFAHGVLADGRLHVVWTDIEERHLWYLSQPLAAS